MNGSDLSGLTSGSFQLPSFAYIVGSAVFGFIGYLAYREAKKTSDWTLYGLAIALNFFSFFIESTWLMFLVGSAMSLVAWFASRMASE